MKNLYPSAWTIIDTARRLVSEHGENPEYDRALLELVSDLTGMGQDESRGDVSVLLGIKQAKNEPEPTPTEPEQVRAKWVEALRSGDYKQGQNRLNTSGRLCCLGVLCELAVEAQVIPPPRESMDSSTKGLIYGPDHDASRFSLPNAVVKWAGLDRTDPRPVGDGRQRSLSQLNDGGKTFAEIADLIEGGLE